jgi:dTDP-4-dehydrorhamnose reductase
MTVLVLGASGMLGFAIHRVLADRGLAVVGTVRKAAPTHPWTAGLRYAEGIEAEAPGDIARLAADLGATTIVNAAGVIKQVAGAADQGVLYRVNSAFPRRLATRLAPSGTRLVHFSTDCVFSGRRGMYAETDLPDADDDYGLSKFLGEPAGPHCIVLRTSIIGLGLAPNASLIDWFLAQTGRVRGFPHAIFSGLPVNAIGELLADRILDREGLAGLWHLSASPIDKASLLEKVAVARGRADIEIVPDESVRIDRSLDSGRLRSEIGWQPPDWDALVSGMNHFYERLGPRPGG